MNGLLVAGITWASLLDPQWYIEYGGLWFLLFIVFAETGLLFGFFFPGDSLLFTIGIFSDAFADSLPGIANPHLYLLLLILLFSLAAVLGNLAGYWFGRSSGQRLYQRRDGLLFKQRYLHRARDFYERYGGQTIVIGRFLPVFRTFAPIIAGIVRMDHRIFLINNILGGFLWVSIMIGSGHYLYRYSLHAHDIDLSEHLGWAILFIVLVTTLPVLLRIGWLWYRRK